MIRIIFIKKLANDFETVQFIELLAGPQQAGNLGAPTLAFALSAAAKAFWGFALWLWSSDGFIAGKRRTSLIVALFVRNMAKRSIPQPHPPVGGRPYSMATQKSSSWT